MKRLLLLLLWCPALLAQTPWSGILDPTRATTWQGNVGFTIPSYSTPCSTQPSFSAGFSNAAANATSLNNAIQSCDATHNVVNLPTGTFYINFWTTGNTGGGTPGKSNVVIRGTSPQLNHLYEVSTGPCAGYATVGGFCIGGNAMYAQNVVVATAPSANSGNQNCAFTGTNGTSGTYTQGATSLLVTNCGGVGNIPVAGLLMVIDQQDDGADNSGIWLCSTFSTVACSQEGTSAQNADGRTIGGKQYSEQQMAEVTAVSLNGGGTAGVGPYTVTISQGLLFNNFRTSQTPGVWWATSNITLDGIENVTLDHENNFATVSCSGTSTVTKTAGTSFTSGMILSGGGGATNSGNLFINGLLYVVTAFGSATSVTVTPNCPTQAGSLAAWNDGTDGGTGGLIIWCYKCWVKNVESINGMENHIDMISDYLPVVRDSYVFANMHSGSEAYAIQMAEVTGGLVENNIIQNTTSPDIKDAVTASVTSYNFSPKINFGNFLQGFYASHNSGSEFNLEEGNVTTEFLGDDVWGTSDLITLFRNQATGWYPGYTQQTFAVTLNSGVRAVNIIGNVLGQPGYHTQYEAYATSTTAGVHTFAAGGSTTAGAGTVNQSIYEMGWSDSAGLGNCNTPPVCDPVTHTSLMRWGNYDVVTAGTVFNSGESSPASVAFVSANSTPATHTLPASFYLPSKPSWWRSMPYPAMGPDVSSGNTGICTSGTYSGLAVTAFGQCSGGSFTAHAWGGFANVNPAQDCYLNVMGGTPDGSAGPFTFDANTCYSGSPPPPPSAPGVVMFATATAH